VNRFRGGLVFKAHRLVYHSTLGLRVIKKKKRRSRVPSSSFRVAVFGVGVLGRGGRHLLLHRHVQRFRGGLVFKAHRLVYHSTLGLRVLKKKVGTSNMRESAARLSRSAK